MQFYSKKSSRVTGLVSRSSVSIAHPLTLYPSFLEVSKTRLRRPAAAEIGSETCKKVFVFDIVTRLRKMLLFYVSFLCLDRAGCPPSASAATPKRVRPRALLGEGGLVLRGGLSAGGGMGRTLAATGGACSSSPRRKMSASWTGSG